MLTVKHFNLVEKSTDSSAASKSDLVELLKFGVMLHPDAQHAAKRVLNYFRTSNITPEQLNSTFYKSWNSITSKTRKELLEDQILHYASTYGTNFDDSKLYLPTEELDIPELNKVPFITINALESLEICERVVDYLQSGMAMSEETVNDMIDILERFHYDFTLLDSNKIKNKEFKVYLFDNKYAEPQTVTELVRFIVFKATGSKLVVKNDELYVALRTSKLDLSDYISSSNIEKISEGFNRFRGVFINLKYTHPKNAKIVNRLSKLSKKHHKPMNKHVLGTLTSLAHPDQDIKDALDGVGNYIKISLLNALMLRMKDAEYFFYRIRNGKGYVKANPYHSSKTYPQAVQAMHEYYLNVYKIVLDSLVSGLKVEPKTYKMTPGVRLALPTSEKSFVGNIPYGTVFHSDKGLSIGVYWENAGGIRDLDLSAMSALGRIGWNSAYADARETLVYSGDITNAPNGASEFMFCSNGLKEPQLILSNVFNGNENGKFKLIVAENKFSKSKKAMVDPNSILLEQELTHLSRQVVLGAVIPAIDTYFVVINTGLGSMSVGGGKTDEARKALLTQLTTRPSLEDILDAAGWTRDDESTDPDVVDLTVGNLAKDTLTSII